MHISIEYYASDTLNYVYVYKDIKLIIKHAVVYIYSGIQIVSVRKPSHLQNYSALNIPKSV